MQRLVMDSGCDLTDDMKSGKIPVEFIPLNLQVGEKIYIDDRDLDMAKYVEDMESYPGRIQTSAPSPELYLDAFKKEGSIFVVTLSAKLSGSYSSAMLAKQMYLEEFGEKFIHIIDGMSACVGGTVIALRVHECIKKNFSDSEIVAAVEKFMSEMRTIFILEKFDNLVKNGRIKPYIAKIATLLSIKVIGGAKDGEIEMVDKARGYKKAVARMIDIIQKDKIDFEDRILAITHIQCLERALEIKDEVMKRIKFKDIVICEGRGIASTYSQKGGIVLSY